MTSSLKVKVSRKQPGWRLEIAEGEVGVVEVVVIELRVIKASDGKQVSGNVMFTKNNCYQERVLEDSRDISKTGLRMESRDLLSHCFIAHLTGAVLEPKHQRLQFNRLLIRQSQGLDPIYIECIQQTCQRHF